MKKILYLLIGITLLLSCGGGRTASSLGEGDTIPMRYAKNITMVRYAEGVKVELKNPWGQGLLGSYWLTNDNDKPNSQLSTLNSQLVHVPLKNTLVFTAVHCGLICELGSVACVRRSTFTD